MGSSKQSISPLLDTLKMERVRTILTPRYPYPHEHSQHAMIAVVVGCLFFISSDSMHTLIQKLDSNIKWWSMYACLLGFFYFFSSPFIRKTIKPSYSNFSSWYVAWILIAALYHLPSFQSMGVDMRMNLSLFLTIYLASVAFLVVFHIVFLGLWYIGLVARVAGKRPEILTIIQNCANATECLAALVLGGKENISQPCDASILLVEANDIMSEQKSDRNFGMRNFKYIYTIKSALESECPMTVSCADIVALSFREGVIMLGGPYISMKTGRRDSKES